MKFRKRRAGLLGKMDVSDGDGVISFVRHFGCSTSSHKSSFCARQSIICAPCFSILSNASVKSVSEST